MIEIIGTTTETGGLPSLYEVVIWADPSAEESLTEQAHSSCRLVVDGLNAVVAEKAGIITAQDLERRRFAGEYVGFEAVPSEARRLQREVEQTEQNRHAFTLLASRVNYDLFGGWDSGIGRPMNMCYMGHPRLQLLVGGIMRGAKLTAERHGLRGDRAAAFYKAQITHTVLRPSELEDYQAKFDPYMVEYL